MSGPVRGRLARVAAAVLLAGLAVSGSTVVAAPTALAASEAPVLSPTDVTVPLGGRFTLQVRIAAATTAGPGTAHLNVVSLDPGQQVDPEDWSSERTRAVPPGGTTASWEVQAVAAGRYEIYVVVIPDDVRAAAAPAVTVGTPTHVTVIGRRTLASRDSLIVSVAMPLLTAAGLVTLRRRSNRGSRSADSG